MSSHRAPALVVTLVLAWGVLAFGAVYAWALWPLAAAVVACAALFMADGVAAIRGQRWLWAAALAAAAIAIQVLPVSQGTLRWLSPAAAASLAVLDVGFASSASALHSLSIAPDRTLTGLAFLVLGTAWTIGCAAMLRRERAPRTLVRHLVSLGSVVALIGLAQQATFNGKLLWFWEPMFDARNSFGPLVNRNHFAGWMLLVAALALGSLYGSWAHEHRAASRDWRRRLLGLDSTSASRTLLTAAAVVMMVCSIVWTMSRSGIAGTAVALAILTVAAAYRARRRNQAAWMAGCLLFGVTSVVAWRGADTLVDWYGNTSTLEWRIALWKDTWPALKDFWQTGSGFNTYGTVMLLYPRTDLTVFPNEAHSDYLQLAVEGGALVVVPVLLLIAAIANEALRRLRQPQDDRTWWIRMGAVAGICGMAVQELTEFSLQIPGVALMFATCVAIAIHEPAPAAAPPARRTVRPTPELVSAL